MLICDTDVYAGDFADNVHSFVGFDAGKSFRHKFEPNLSTSAWQAFDQYTWEVGLDKSDVIGKYWDFGINNYVCVVFACQ